MRLDSQSGEGMMYKLLVEILLFAFPWPLRRRALGWLLGYEIAADAVIGFSVVLHPS